MYGITSIIEKDMILNNIKILSANKQMYEQTNNKNRKCIVITNIVEFLNRIEIALKSGGFKYSSGIVKYYNEKTYVGDLTPFDKSNKFEHENEFRFVIESEGIKPILLEIGSIKDISTTLYNGNEISYGFK